MEEPPSNVRLSTAFAAAVFGSPPPSSRRERSTAFAVGSPRQTGGLPMPTSPAKARAISIASHEWSRNSHSHFADLPARHKDDHHSDVNDYFLNGPKAPLQDHTNDERLDLQWRMEEEQRARELQAKVDAEHAEAERERRLARELQDKLRREELHEQKLEHQLERLRQDFDEDHASSNREIERVREELLESQEQLSKKSRELVLANQKLEHAESQSPRQSRKIAELQEQLEAEQEARHLSDSKWAEQLTSHKERLAHSLESAHRTLAEREAQLTAENEQLTTQLQKSEEQRRKQHTSHAEREAEWARKLAGQQERLARGIDKAEKAAATVEAELIDENTKLKQRIAQMKEGEEVWSRRMAEHQDRFAHSVEEFQQTATQHEEKLTDEIHELQKKLQAVTDENNQQQKLIGVLTARLDNAEAAVLEQQRELEMSKSMTLVDNDRMQAQWIQQFQAKQHEVENFVRLMEFKENKMLMKTAFTSWKDSHALYQRGSKVLRRMMRLAVALSLQKWKQCVTEMQYQRNRLARVLARFLQVAIARAFGTWCNLVVEATQTRVALTRVIGRFTMAAAARAFSSWAEAWETGKMHRIAMARIVSRIQNAAVAGAFTKWKDIRRQAQGARNMMKRLLNTQLMMVMHQWSEWVVTERATRVALTRVIGRFTMAAAARAFSSWAEAWETGKMHRIAMARIVSRIQNAAVAGAFTKWAETRRQAQGARNMMKRLLNTQLMMVMNQWSEWVVTERATRVALTRVIGRFTMAAAARAFSSWAEAWETGKMHRIAMARIVSRIQNAAVAGAFTKWAETRRQAQGARNMMKRLLNTQLMMVMNQWSEWVVTERATRVALTRVIGRFTMAAAARAFSSWAEAWETGKMHRIAMARIVSRIQNAAVAGAFTKWAETRWQTQGARNMMKRLLNTQLMMVMNQWSEWVVTERATRVALTRVIGRFTMAAAARAFSSWAEAWETGKMHRIAMARIVSRIQNAAVAGAFTKWAETRRQTQGARNMMKRLLNTQLMMVMNQWSEWVVTERATRVALTRVIGRFTMAAAARAFSSWAEAWETGKMHRIAMARIVSRIQNAAVAASFDSWYRFFDTSQRNAAVLSRVLLRMNQKCLWYAWDGLVEAIAVSKANKAKLSRALVRIVKSAMLKALLKWVQFTIAVRKARKVMQRLVKRHLTLALESWIELVQETKEALAAEELSKAFSQLQLMQQRSAERILSRWQNTSMATCFKFWQDYCTKLNTLKNKMGMLVMRSSTNLLATIFKAFKALVSQHKFQSTAVQKVVRRLRVFAVSRSFSTWKDQHCLLKKCKRVLARIARRDVVSGFVQWVSITVSMRQNRKLVQRCVAKLLQVALARAFDQWMIVADDLRVQRTRVVRVLARFKMAAAASAFSTWTETAVSLRQMRATLNRVVQKFANISVARALASWAETTETAKAHRIVLNRIVSRITNASVAKAFATWSETKWQLQNVRRMMKRLLNQQLVMAMNQWSKWAEIERTMRATLNRVIGRFTMGAVARAFASWVESAKLAKTHRAAMERAVSRFLNLAVHSAFNTWADTRRQIRTLRRIMNRVLNRQLAQSINQWIEWAETERVTRVSLRRVIVRFTMAAIARAFETWLVMAAQEKELRHKLTRIIARFTMMGVVKAFVSWSDTCVTLKRQREGMTRIILRFQHSTTSAAFGTWCRSVIGSKKAKAQAQAEQLQRMLDAKRESTLGRLATWTQNGLLRKSLNEWQVSTRKAVTMRRSIAHVLRRLQLGLVKSQFLLWNQNAQKSRETMVTLGRAMGKMLHALVGRAWCQWLTVVKMVKLCSKVMRRMIYRRTMMSFQRWQKATQVGRRLRQDARLKAAQIEVDQQNRALQQQISQSSVLRERMGSLLLKWQTFKKMELQLRLSYKQWQIEWLNGKLVKVRQNTLYEVRRSQESSDSVQAKLMQNKTTIQSLKNQLAAAKVEADELRTCTKLSKQQARSAEESSVQMVELRNQIATLSEELASCRLAKDKSDQSCAASKSALERAQLVQSEEMRALQGEIDRQNMERNEWEMERRSLERAAGRVDSMESLLERKNLEKAMLERQLSAKPPPELASYIEGYMLAATNKEDPPTAVLESLSDRRFK